MKQIDNEDFLTTALIIAIVVFLLVFIGGGIMMSKII